MSSGSATATATAAADAGAGAGAPLLDLDAYVGSPANAPALRAGLRCLRAALADRDPTGKFKRSLPSAPPFAAIVEPMMCGLPQRDAEKHRALYPVGFALAGEATRAVVNRKWKAAMPIVYRLAREPMPSMARDTTLDAALPPELVERAVAALGPERGCKRPAAAAAAAAAPGSPRPSKVARAVEGAIQARTRASHRMRVVDVGDERRLVVPVPDAAEVEAADGDGNGGGDGEPQPHIVMADSESGWVCVYALAHAAKLDPSVVRIDKEVCKVRIKDGRAVAVLAKITSAPASPSGAAAGATAAAPAR